VGLAETEAFVHLGPKPPVRGTLSGQTAESGEGGLLASVADGAAAALERLRQADLIEIAGGQLARLPAHRTNVFSLRRVIGQA
jgi:hypothetical protein